MDWFYYDLIILINLCKISNKNLNFKQKFRRNSIVFEKLGIFPEKLKTLTSSNYYRVQYFLLKLRTPFLLTNVYKRVFGIFFILFRSWVTCKNKKTLVSTYSFFTFLLITQDLNKIKKNPKYAFIDIVKSETFAKFHQKILNFMVVEFVKVFNFSDK